MAFIPVPNAIKVSLEFIVGGQLVVLTLGFSKASAITLGDLNSAAAGAGGWAQTTLMPLLSNQISYTGVTAYDLSAVDAPKVHVTPASPVAGGSVGPAEANNVAYVVSMRTNSRGRGARGRNYVPGVPAAVVNSPTTVTTAFSTALGSAYATLMDNFLSISMPLSVISRYLNKVPRTAGIARPVTSLVTDPNVDSQRRRLAGRGI